MSAKQPAGRPEPKPRPTRPRAARKSDKEYFSRDPRQLDLILHTPLIDDPAVARQEAPKPRNNPKPNGYDEEFWRPE